MSNSTIMLSRTVAMTQQFIRNAPLTFGTNLDPALTIGDWVRQFILGPPFAWRWNRNVATFKTIATPATTDYKVSMSDFGWLESASFSVGGATKELEVKLNLEPDTSPNQPVHISTQYDDGNDNITFRLFPAPDQVYTVSLTYQRKAKNFALLGDFWNPVPDFMSNLYNQGFLAKTYEYFSDPRASGTMIMFLRQVIAANDGLTDSQVNIFMKDFEANMRTPMITQGNTQQGRQTRGLY